MQEPVRAPDAPAPIGPYSPALIWRDLVFISGQGPIDPATGRIREGDFDGQVRQTLANIDALLTAAGSARQHVLKAQVYLTDLRNFDALNRLYASFFEGCCPPARTTMQVAALPGGIEVEIDVIAYRREAG